MVKVLRYDYRIELYDGRLLLKNTNYPKVIYQLTPQEAMILSFFDGNQDENAVIEQLKLIFKNSIVENILKKLNRFLISKELADALFDRSGEMINRQQFQMNRRFGLLKMRLTVCTNFS